MAGRVAGLLAAAGLLGSDVAPPVMHLRNMNPYVTAALADWPKSARLSSRIPVQQAVGNLASATTGATCAGTSSFGMSGVNAHALLCCPSPARTTTIQAQVSASSVLLPLPKSYYVASLQSQSSSDTTPQVTILKLILRVSGDRQLM